MTAITTSRGPRRELLRFAIIAFAAMVMVFVGVADDARAQDRPRSLFEFLFRGGRESARQPERRVPQVKKRTTTRRATPRSSTAQRSAPVEPAPAAVEKAETARVVLVVGDFIAGGLAEGLEAVYAENPSVRIVERSNGSSGFVRDDFYDWPASIGSILEEEAPAAAVVLIGSNDRQQMVVEGKRESVRSEKWNEEYATRIEAFIKEFADRRIPVVWLGLPAFRFSSMSSDMLAFNDIQRNAVEAVGGTFVDIWDGFVDENGAFAASGPDINGQPVRLRASDGINFTKAGRRKIAFYAEKPLARILGDGQPIVLPDLIIPELVGPPTAGQPAIDRTPPISLSDPALDGSEELLGFGFEPRDDDAQTLSEKLAIEGIAPPPAPGRADDFGIYTQPVAAPAKIEPAPASGERTSGISE